MSNKLSNSVSYIFHPIILPTLTVLYIFFLPTYLSIFPFAFKKALLIIFFLMTFIAPILSMIILQNLKIISKFSLSEQKERIIPLAITASFYSAVYIIFYFFPYKIPPVLTAFALTVALGVVSALLISLAYKISAHTIAIGAVTGFLFVFYFRFNAGNSMHLAVLILISGTVAYARLKENSHTPLQVYAGYFTGLFIGLLSFLMY